jgi:hypothetical protein
VCRVIELGAAEPLNSLRELALRIFRERQTSLPTVKLDFLQLILETQAETTRWIMDEVDCFMCQIHSLNEQGQLTYNVLRSYYFGVENPDGTSSASFAAFAHRQLRQHLIY